MFIRQEALGDAAAIERVHLTAFAREDQAGLPEARLVGELRADGSIVDGLSLVAVDDGEIVGHVVCSPATIGDQEALGLGPLGVFPTAQRSGVGLALMHAVIAAADALRAPAIVLLGSPSYYSRFGFVLAEPLGILAPHREWSPHFQVRTLTAYTPALRGTFTYAPAFQRLPDA